MKRTILLLIPTLFIALIFSCKKGDNGERTTVIAGSYRTLDEALASAAPITKTTSIIVSTGGTLIAPNGTLIYFPPNAFETLKGAKVTGSVQVSFNDWLKKGDMVFGKVLPIAAGAPLESAGEGYLMATQNGLAVRPKIGAPISFHFPQFGVTPTLAYTGWIGRTVYGSSNTVNWISTDSTHLYPTVNGSDTVYAAADTLPYVQPAIPLVYTVKNNFSIVLKSPVQLDQSLAVVLYDHHNSLFPLPSAINGIVNAANVPNSTGSIHVAVMGINAGNFYGGIVAIPLQASDSSYDVTIKAYDPALFKIQLNSL